MERCKSCRWWGKVDWDYEREADPPDCTRDEAMIPIPSRPCGSPKIHDVSSKTIHDMGYDLAAQYMAQMPTEEALHYDPSGYSEFRTGPDFGCVHHQAKE